MSKYKKSADTKQKILETTVSLVLENGYANLNIKDIADRLEMPRSLIYYYFKNRDDIMTDLYYNTYQKISSLAERLVQDQENPLLHLIVKYILHYRYVIQNAVLREFYFSRPPYVYQGREAVHSALDTCYIASRKAFQQLRPDASENDLYMFVITCDSLAHTLFEGLANGVLAMNLRDAILYFGECSIMVNFAISREEMARIVDEAFMLTDSISFPPGSL